MKHAIMFPTRNIPIASPPIQVLRHLVRRLWATHSFVAMSTQPKLPDLPPNLREVEHAGRQAARLFAKVAPLSSTQQSWLSGFLAELLELPPDNAASLHGAPEPLSSANPDAFSIESNDDRTRAIETAMDRLRSRSTAQTHSVDNPFSARITNIQPNSENAPNVWRVTLDVANSGIVARPGATLGAIPINDPDHVRDLLSRFKGAGQHSVTTSRGSGPAWRALLEECNLFRITEPLLRQLAASTQRNSEATELKRIAASGEHQGSVLGLLRRFPGAKPTIAEFVASLAPLTAQIFPISTGSAKTGTQIEAVIGKEPDDGRSVVERLAQGKLRVGEWMPIFITLRPEAHPPEELSAPVIVIAPGLTASWANTLLSERASARATGRNWVFTCPPPGESSVLYSDALSTWQSNRTLTRLDIAPPGELFNRIGEHGDMIQAWLLDQSYLYLFGSAQECRQLVATMSTLLATRMKTSSSDAELRLSEMRSRGLLRVVSTD